MVFSWNEIRSIEEWVLFFHDPVGMLNEPRPTSETQAYLVTNSDHDKITLRDDSIDRLAFLGIKLREVALRLAIPWEVVSDHRYRLPE